MGITNELRHEVANYPFRDNRDFALFEDIADRIDIAHKHAIGYVDDRDSETMAENGWVRLPKDADGEYIHIGDLMECEKLPNGKRVCGEVKAIGDGYVWLMNVQYKIHAEYLHHHRPDTWERIIDDAVNVHGNGFNPFWTDERDALVARCKALADDGEGQ